MTLSTLTDEELATRAQREPGLGASLTTLIERHHNRLLGFLYRMCHGDRALAEDLVQDTFLKTMRAIGQYRAPRPFKAWLYAIAVNVARDHFKRADTRYTLALSDDQDSAVEPELDEPLLRAENARSVARALSALPLPQRETIILRYYEDLSLDDVALTLAIPVGTVKSRLSLGLKRLRAELETAL